MFCDYCGTRLPEGAGVCPQCGKSLGWNSNYPEDSHQVEYQEDDFREENGIAKQAQEAAQAASKAVHRVARKVNNSAKSIVQNMDINRESSFENQNKWNTPNSTIYEQNNYSTPNYNHDTSLPAIGFFLAEGETIIRRYLCAEIKSSIFNPSGKGHITVTNKRLVYEGKSGDSRISMEAPVDSIGGLYSYYGKNINVMMLIIGVILVILGWRTAFGRSSANSLMVLGLTCLIIGCILVFLAFRPCYQMVVYSNKATGSAITVGEGPKTKLGNGAIHTIQADPTRETDIMMAEIGAIIQDIQQIGDRAIEKWKR